MKGRRKGEHDRTRERGHDQMYLHRFIVHNEEGKFR